MQVAEAALCVLHNVLLGISLRFEMSRAMSHAVVAADLHQPLLALMRIHPQSQGACKVCRQAVLLPVLGRSGQQSTMPWCWVGMLAV